MVGKQWKGVEKFFLIILREGGKEGGREGPGAWGREGKREKEREPEGEEGREGGREQPEVSVLSRHHRRSRLHRAAAPAARSSHAAPSHTMSLQIAFGSWQARAVLTVKQCCAAVGALKTQKLGPATVCTRETASIWEPHTLEHRPLRVRAQILWAQWWMSDIECDGWWMSVMAWLQQSECLE